MGRWALVSSVLPLGVLVIVHEMGHFVVARWMGVRILRFSIGFGPRLLTWTRGHTEYAVSAIPLGGYVKMAGEQDAEGPPEPWDYRAQSVGRRAAIIAAGPVVNYLLAALSLWTVFVIGYPELLPIVGKVMPEMPAAAAGLETGDRIRAIDGVPVRTWEDMTKVIYRSPGRALALDVDRGGSFRTITVQPKPRTIPGPLGQPKEVGLIGIAPSGEFATYRVSPLKAVTRTIEQQNEWVAQTFAAFWLLFTGKLAPQDSVIGPIGILYLTSEALRLGFSPVLFLISLFSLSLAIFNLLPIPILDGGHLFFLAMERFRGKPVSLQVQERSAQVSFVLLMALVLMICISDVSRFGLLEKVTGWFSK